MSSPLVSVIMNCFNGDRYLRQAIQSVIDQTYDHWEIVFWDNQSTDDSAEIVKSFDDPRVRYFFAPRFTPLGEARNAALAEARGDWIGFLDVDDEWLPKKLEVQIGRYDREPDRENIGLIYSGMFWRSESGEQVTSEPEDRRGNLFRENIRSFQIWLQTTLVSRAAIDRLQLRFDDHLNVVEEFDFFMRVAFYYDALQIREPTAIYRFHPGNLTFKRSDLWFKEHFYIMEKLKEDLGLDDSYAEDWEIFYRKFMAYMMDHWRAQVLDHGKGAEYLDVYKNIQRKNLSSRLIYWTAQGVIPQWLTRRMFDVVRRVRAPKA